MNVKFIFFMILCSYQLVFTQDTLKIMTYNLLNYPGTDTTTRNPYFRTIMQAVNPDILVVQEVTSHAGVNGFLNNVLNSVYPSTFSAGTFIDGNDTDNAIFYKSSKINFISNKPIQTELRNISEFKLYHTASAETLRVYSVHLKASSGSANEAQRARETDSLRKITNALPDGKNFIVVGDFNIYSSAESAYQKLLQDDLDNDGHFIDPITMTGTWNNSLYAQYHTQSPRLRSFGGGATGGLDDRFDMILYSRTVSEFGGISFITGSLVTYGNDGNHYNDSINSIPNSAVSQGIADALHYASDHLPVYALFRFTPTEMPVRLVSFVTSINKNKVELKWSTASEVQNYGFEIEKSKDSKIERFKEWKKIGFVKGAGNSNSPKEYSFVDQTTLYGNYSYRLKQIDLDGSFEYSDAVTVTVGSRPQVYDVKNFPNPFNPITTIRFELPKASKVKLSVYDITGQLIATLVDEYLEEGIYQEAFDARDLPSGVYFSILQTEGIKVTRKILLIK